MHLHTLTINALFNSHAVVTENVHGTLAVESPAWSPCQGAGGNFIFRCHTKSQRSCYQRGNPQILHLYDVVVSFSFKASEELTIRSVGLRYRKNKVVILTCHPAAALASVVPKLLVVAVFILGTQKLVCTWDALPKAFPSISVQTRVVISLFSRRLLHVEFSQRIPFFNFTWCLNRCLSFQWSPCTTRIEGPEDSLLYALNNSLLIISSVLSPCLFSHMPSIVLTLQTAVVLRPKCVQYHR